MSTLLMASSGEQVVTAAEKSSTICESPKSKLAQQFRKMVEFATDAWNVGYYNLDDLYEERAMLAVKDETKSSNVTTEGHHNISSVKKENFTTCEVLKSKLAQKFRKMVEFATDVWNVGYVNLGDLRAEREKNMAVGKFATKPERIVNSDMGEPECNLHYHSEGPILTKLVDIYSNSPDKAGDAIKEFARKAVQDLSSTLKRDEVTRLLLDLEQPRFPIDLARQRAELSGADEELSEIEKGQVMSEWGNYKKMAVDVRCKVLGAFKVELTKTNLLDENSSVAVLGEYIGAGAVGELFSCAVDGNSENEVVAKAHHVSDSNNGRQCLVGDYPPELIAATSKSRYLIKAFGTLYAKALQGGRQRPRRFDILEKVNGAVELKDYLKKYSIGDFSGYGLEEARSNCIKFLQSVFLPVLNGVKALHDEGLVHRDLKPENILIIPHSDEFGDCTIKMNDYDLVCRVGDDIKIWGGSPSFACPEWKDLKNINCSSDIYSLGMALYEFFGGKMSKEVQELGPLEQVGYAALDKGDSVDLDAPPAVIQIIEKCLQRDPNKRININELIGRVADLVSIISMGTTHEEGDQTEVRESALLSLEKGLLAA